MGVVTLDVRYNSFLKWSDYFLAFGRELLKRPFRDGEIHLSRWNKVCLFHARLALAAQRCSLFGPDHPSIAAQLLRFWLYFMSPNCEWPGPPLASFQVWSFLQNGASRPISVAVCWPRTLHGTVRDMSQVHPPLGWYGSQLTSTCPLGPASPFTPRPPASIWDYLTYPARLLLQLLNKTLSLFTNTVGGKTLLLGCFRVYMMVLCCGIKIQSTWVCSRKWMKPWIILNPLCILKY